jgi:hypothetical protein
MKNIFDNKYKFSLLTYLSLFSIILPLLLPFLLLYPNLFMVILSTILNIIIAYLSFVTSETEDKLDNSKIDNPLIKKMKEDYKYENRFLRR